MTEAETETPEDDSAEEIVQKWAKEHGMEFDGKHVTHDERNMVRLRDGGEVIVWGKGIELMGELVGIRDDAARSLELQNVERERKCDNWLVTMGPWGEKLYAKGVEDGR